MWFLKYQCIVSISVVSGLFTFFQSSQKDIKRLKDREGKLVGELQNSSREIQRLRIAMIEITPEYSV
jgi:hypothetical protein